MRLRTSVSLWFISTRQFNRSLDLNRTQVVYYHCRACIFSEISIKIAEVELKLINLGLQLSFRFFLCVEPLRRGRV